MASTGGALVERARRDNVPVIPIPGGFQPRAAIGYSLVAALEAAALGGAAPSLRDEIEAAADLAEALAAEWGPEGDESSEAKAIARSLHGTVPVIAGAEVGAAAAYRWKCQFNENAQLPAFASALPELSHNEVVGWESARELGRFSYVSLEDPDAHERNRLRAELTTEIASAGADPVVRVQARGASRVERLVSLVLLGDLVSIYAAVLRGADPVDIPRDRLAESISGFALAQAAAAAVVLARLGRGRVRRPALAAGRRVRRDDLGRHPGARRGGADRPVPGRALLGDPDVLEVIVVDDGSTDATAAVAARRAAPAW